MTRIFIRVKRKYLFYPARSNASPPYTTSIAMSFTVSRLFAYSVFISMLYSPASASRLFAPGRITPACAGNTAVAAGFIPWHIVFDLLFFSFARKSYIGDFERMGYNICNDRVVLRLNFPQALPWVGF